MIKFLEEEDENLDTVRKFSNNHPFPGFFSITMATRKKEHYGTVRNKQHKLLVNTAVLTFDNASEWGDTITPIENIMKSFHSILICHDRNNESSASSRCDPTAYPTRKSITALATNNTSSLMRLLFSLFYGESFDDVKEQMTKRKETNKWDQMIRTIYFLSSVGCSIRQNRGGGTVQRLLAAHATAQNMGGNLFQLLQLSGITPLKSTKIQRRNKNCNTILADGFDYGTTSIYDYYKKDFDNMHGVGGYNTTKQDSFGVTETTQQVNSIYTSKQATDDGLYYDTANPGRVPLDRTKLN